jgi:hypothetical protein
VKLRWLIAVVLLLAIAAQAQPSAIPGVPAQSTPPLAAVKPGAPASEIRVECAPASRATALIGQHGCVAGRVFRVTTGKTGNTHIALCPSRSKCTFQAVVRGHDRAEVGDLTYLRGRIVAITGDVTHYRGHPQIAITQAEQIHVAASDAPSQFDVDQAKPAINPQAMRGTKHDRAW